MFPQDDDAHLDAWALHTGSRASVQRISGFLGSRSLLLITTYKTCQKRLARFGLPFDFITWVDGI
jgi:hypothetical protein